MRAACWRQRASTQRPLRWRSRQSVAGEKVRTRPCRIFLGQKIGNSQSDGIAANHSRELRVQLGFEQIAVARRRAFRQFIRW